LSLLANQVLDARDPLGCISPEVEKWIRFNYPDKLFVRLLNKIGIIILLASNPLRSVQFFNHRKRGTLSEMFYCL
jgi:hypothetical protein